jgi:hypothetical protein
VGRSSARTAAAARTEWRAAAEELAEQARGALAGEQHGKGLKVRL